MNLLNNTEKHLKDIDGIAYTAGPGLAGALLVGARIRPKFSLCLWSKPALSLFITWKVTYSHRCSVTLNPAFLALLVSGGHTQLVDVSSFGQYKVLGETVDDAAREAFDKTAKLLGLPYPGGAALSQLAHSGQPDRFHFPKTYARSSGLDFSFGQNLCVKYLASLRQ